MNIFYLDSDPKLCAQWAVDRHCVKMILEYSQLLSTAHRVLDGVETVIEKIVSERGTALDELITTITGINFTTRKKKVWVLPDERNSKLYAATHINHPSAIWVRESADNYKWLHSLLIESLKEYTYRYDKIHKAELTDLHIALAKLPDNIPKGNMTTMPQAMPDEYKSEFPTEGYRNYYKYGKSHLHSWKKRQPPEWII